MLWESARMLRVSVTSAAIAPAIALAPSAAADPSDFQYVRTETGAVRCVISASLDAGGAFDWGEGNIGGVDADEVTLAHGQAYHVRGRTVAPSIDGTRFTNDASGHGMFVSTGGVNPF